MLDMPNQPVVHDLQSLDLGFSSSDDEPQPEPEDVQMPSDIHHQPVNEDNRSLDLGFAFSEDNRMSHINHQPVHDDHRLDLGFSFSDDDRISDMYHHPAPVFNRSSHIPTPEAHQDLDLQFPPESIDGLDLGFDHPQSDTDTCQPVHSTGSPHTGKSDDI
jgi:hypothetical protein